MAVPIKVCQDGFKYTQYVDEFDVLKRDATSKFQALQQSGVIKNKNFNDSTWTMDDEIRKVSIDFSFKNERKYEGVCNNKLNVSLKQYQLSMKLYVTAQYGLQIHTLVNIAKGCKQLLRYLTEDVTVSTLDKYGPWLKEFIHYIPHHKPHWKTVSDIIDAIAISPTNKNQRKLGNYVSYFRFDRILTEFWSKAEQSDKTLYFPIFFWWNLTAILPLRPTEFTLIPRDCLQEIDGIWYVSIRRTKLKGEKGAEYTIDKDYDLLQYPIPQKLALEVSNYVKNTDEGYSSDINTLFCQSYQYKAMNLRRSNNRVHYTYENLRSCLNHFYKTQIPRMGVQVVNKVSAYNEQPLDAGTDKIERIDLGDTRHIALINLIYSGGSPTICKELARHDSIDMSSHYYTNISTFIEAMVSEHPRIESEPEPYIQEMVINPVKLLDKNGFCGSHGVKCGDYSDCWAAINPQGEPLDCAYCKFNTRAKKGFFQTDFQKLATVENTQKLLSNSCIELKEAIELVRKGLGYECDIQAKILKLQASSIHYFNAIKHTPRR